VLEGGKPNPKGMLFIVQSSSYVFSSLENLKRMIG